MEYGHHAKNLYLPEFIARIDAWGTGPFMFRIDGRRVFFEDSARFGPAVLRKRDMNPSDNQPGEKYRFWDAYGMWRKAGRPLRGTGKIKIAVWKEPQPGRYWIDEKTGISHLLNDPDLEDGPYRRVPKPLKSGVA